MVFFGIRMNAQSDEPLVAFETTIELDYFGSELSAWLYWINEDGSLTLVEEWWGYPNGQQGATFVDTLYLAQGCYYIIVQDDYGDGFGFTHGGVYHKQLRDAPLSDTTLVNLVNNYENFEGTICMFSPQEVVTEVYGCMDSLACNYDPTATVQYGECVHVGDTCDDGIEFSLNDTISTNCECHGTITILGCMDDSALNYNFEATIDDGTCIYPIVGCMDYAACNYDPTATLNNGCDFVSCIVIGCTDPWAFNYDPTATQPNFLDPYFGCEYWIPTEISVVQTCNDFTFTASASDGSPMPFVFANIYNWTIGNDISVEMVGPSVSYSITEDGTYVVVFVYAQGAFITSVETIVSTGACPGDFNCDRTISVTDLLMLISDFSCVEDCTTDMDTDGIVGVSDLISFISVYGTNCPN